MKNFLIYGSYGYTGQLVVELAVKQGMRPILAGRDEKKLRAQVEQYKLEYRAFSLDETDKLNAALLEVDAVLHCAGPFVLTFRQMAEACIRTKRHYVDISGEIEGFEALAKMSDDAKQAGIMLLPGGGFDVVPSDCLAAHLKRRIAGLSAGLHLAERGLHPFILEADEKFIGGRLAGGETVQVGGASFRLEHGVHGIWSQYRNLQAMLARHNLRPVFVPAQEENWIYRAGKFVGVAPVGSAIRRSFLPPPLHYLQLFLRGRFLWMLDLRDWASLFNVWAGLIMAVGIDPYAENQPMEGMTLVHMTRRWSPALKSFFLGLARNGLSSHPDEVSISGFIMLKFNIIQQY